MQLRLASVFTSHMVLQQQTRVPIWGQAAPGARVTVQVQKQAQRVEADRVTGAWRVHLEPMPASFEPITLTVIAASSDHPDETLKLENVLVGEVWLCSGQSNMEWPVRLSGNAEEEMAAANFPAIRLLKYGRVSTAAPRLEAPGAQWMSCSPDSVFDFSAVGYHFGVAIQKKLNVPVGLINCSWGGTLAEAWTSREGLLAEPSARYIVETFEKQLPDFELAMERWREEIKPIEARIADENLPVNPGFTRGWADVAEPTQGEWKSMDLPGSWQSKGLRFSGVFWFRKTVDVPAHWAGKDLTLSIGATDKSDVTYFNNTFVGSLTMAQRSDAWSMPRVYTVPGALVKAGRNVIAVRIHSDRYDGGAIGPASIMKLTCDADPGSKPIALAGAWQYAIEANYGLVEIPAQPITAEHANAPAALFNGMISPLVPMAMRGVIWYQGESNAPRAREYRTLFPALIRDWRKQFAHPTLAFHFVQLANFRAPNDQPVESEWALLREAQTMALQLPHTGMAVAIDIGDAADIHPRNKKDVGKRLACAALHTTYGCTDIVQSGPLYKSSRVEGSSIRIAFDHVAGGLVAKGGALRDFAIAGPDGKFVWGDAVIDGPTVVVRHAAITEPRAVRYNWSDNPAGNLYNSVGLPASPFRTDVD